LLPLMIGTDVAPAPMQYFYAVPLLWQPPKHYGAQLVDENQPEVSKHTDFKLEVRNGNLISSYTTHHFIGNWGGARSTA
jgi:hypothetical protein